MSYTSSTSGRSSKGSKKSSKATKSKSGKSKSSKSKSSKSKQGKRNLHAVSKVREGDVKELRRDQRTNKYQERNNESGSRNLRHRI